MAADNSNGRGRTMPGVLLAMLAAIAFAAAPAAVWAAGAEGLRHAGRDTRD